MSYDLIVIGTGPGGYVAAIRAAQLGLKVGVIEKRATHGGTCLNIGCIPSKALLHASEVFEEANHTMAKLGVVATVISLDLPTMMAHKDATVKSNVQGIEFLFKKNKITAHHGLGTILAPGKVQVTKNDGSTEVLEAKAILIATGSDVVSLPGITIDEKTVVSSTGALDLAKVPERLTVIGGGVIGLELGSVWSRLGAKVTVVEYLDRIVPGFDLELAKAFQRLLEKQGFTFKLGQKVTGVATAASGVSTVTFEPAAGGAAESLEADIVLVAVGRKAYTEDLGLDAVGVARDARGRVVTDHHFQSNVPGIYAIGDVIAGPMLAHKAEDEGVAFAEILSGQAGHVNYDVIPGVVYTNPELATVGKTEEDLKAAGIAYKIGKFPFTANGRAKANLASDGFVKILADAKTDRVLGAHIVGANAGELIHEVAVLMEFSGSAEDLARTVHAHPTLSEAVKEAALAVDKRPIHI